jgi:ATPase subunit of ABC transporter with duplicated ATPase domains
VLKDITLAFYPGAKIGVLGLNGSGKSSLLRILAGVDKDFNGEAILSPGYTVGYLEQEPLIDDSRTVREVVQGAVQETSDLLKEFEQISARFAEEMSDDEMNALLERQGEVQEKRRQEQRGRQVAAHALAQAQLPDRSVEEAIEFQGVSEDLQVGVAGAVEVLDAAPLAVAGDPDEGAGDHGRAAGAVPDEQPVRAGAGVGLGGALAA